jgi:hypothetical protein
MANDKHRQDEIRDEDDAREESERESQATNGQPNPPRTTTHGWTSPKFGSSGSGGAELEPGPERD